MKISIGSDHAGFIYKGAVIGILNDCGFTVLDRGTYDDSSCDYVDFAQHVARDVLDEKSECGILICYSGIGMSMVANKYCGIRAALCHDIRSAVLAKEHNNSNILCLGSGIVSKDELAAILKSFIDTEFDRSVRHVKRIDKFRNLGQK